MNEHKHLPQDLTPINLKAYFYNALNACGCSELDAMHAATVRLLEWHEMPHLGRPRYNDLYTDPGVFYLLAGLFDDLGLAEHGTSIRGPWLTKDGKRLLVALRQHTGDEMDAASGTAYDGAHYGHL